jgi:hypothetical protein
MMTPRMRQRSRRSPIRGRERGSAMLVVTIVMLLIGTIAVSAINQSGGEAAASGRTRAITRNLYAADSGIQLAESRLAQGVPNTNPISFVFEGGQTVESRRRSEIGSQPLVKVGTGPPPDGYQINAGSSFSNSVYLINITSVAPNRTTTELESRLVRLQAGTGGQ